MEIWIFNCLQVPPYHDFEKVMILAKDNFEKVEGGVLYFYQSHA